MTDDQHETKDPAGEPESALWNVELEEARYDLIAKTQGHLTKEALLAIDLNRFDELVTYPAGFDWPLERKKILFLQTAVSLGFAWLRVAQLTYPHFGQVLSPSFELGVVPIEPEPFVPPPFDIARHTPGQWAIAADRAWDEYRTNILRRITEWRKAQIDQGLLKEYSHLREHSGITGLKKAAIVDEPTAFEWAVFSFFKAQPSELAELYPPPNGWPRITRDAAKEKRKGADQIRKRANALLKDLGLRK